MKKMPEPGRFSKGKFFYHWFFQFQVSNHFLNSYSVISYSRSFSKTRLTKLVNTYNQRWLMCFRSFGNSEWIFKPEITRDVLNFHRVHYLPDDLIISLSCSL